MDTYKDLQDNDLLLLLQKDDQKALSALYYRYWDKLLSVALHRLQDEYLAAGCVQDIFISLWQRRHQLSLTKTLSAYLAVAVKYRVITHLSKETKAQQKNELLQLQTDGQLFPSADQHLLEKELWQSVEQAIAGLPEKCQIVFKMSRQQGLSNKEIAGELNISEKTVEAHMTKALRDLKDNLIIAGPALMTWLLGIK